MSATTDTPEVTTEAVVIDDDSHVAEGALTRLKNAAAKMRDKIIEAIPLDEKLASIYQAAATAKAVTRSLVLLSDGDPDWTGGSATYRSILAEYEDAAWKGASAKRKSTLENNVRSAMRRGCLDAVVVDWVRTNVAGMDKVEKGKEKDSAEFRKAMRHQYQRGHDLKMPNPIACPDHWKDTPPADTSVDAKTEDTAASNLSKALSSIGELSVVEALDSQHRLFSATLTPIVQPNAKVAGGRDAAAAVLRKMVTQGFAALTILEGKTSGEDLEKAQASFVKNTHADS